MKKDRNYILVDILLRAISTCIFKCSLLLLGLAVLVLSNNAEAANYVLGVRTITGTTGTAQNPTAAISNVPAGAQLNKTFHFCSYSYDVGDSLHDQTFKGSELTAVGTMTFRAGQASGNQSVTYQCQIVYFSTDSDLVVQRSNVPSTSTTNNYTCSPTLSATNRSFVIPHGERDPSDTTVGSEEIWEYQLSGTGTNCLQVIVDAANNSGGGNNVYFEIVDWGNTDITVQHINNNTMTTGETSDQIDITAVDRTKTWLIGSATWDGIGATGSPADDAAIRLEFVDNDTIQIIKQNSGVQIEWSAQVIEATSDNVFNVERGTINMSTAETTDTLNINYVNTQRSVAIGTMTMGFAYTGLSNDTSTSNHDTVNATVVLTDSTTITATRGVTNTTTLDIEVQAVHFRGPFPGAVMVVD